VKGCDDPTGRHLGRGGPTNPPQKEQCRKAVRTVLRTGPGVQRPEALTTNRYLLTLILLRLSNQGKQPRKVITLLTASRREHSN